MLTTRETLALADRVRLALGRLARRLRRHSRGGLTPSQSSVLATLDRHGPLAMGRLAEIEGVSPPAVTGVAARLVERRLVERRADTRDRRSVLLSLTREGREVLERARRERTAVLAVQLNRLSGAERRLLAEAVEILDRLADEE